MNKLKLLAVGLVTSAGASLAMATETPTPTDTSAALEGIVENGVTLFNTSVGIGIAIVTYIFLKGIFMRVAR